MVRHHLGPISGPIWPIFAYFGGLKTQFWAWYGGLEPRPESILDDYEPILEVQRSFRAYFAYFGGLKTQFWAWYGGSEPRPESILDDFEPILEVQRSFRAYFRLFWRVGDPNLGLIQRPWVPFRGMGHFEPIMGLLMVHSGLFWA